MSAKYSEEPGKEERVVSLGRSWCSSCAQRWDEPKAGRGSSVAGDKSLSWTQIRIHPEQWGWAGSPHHPWGCREPKSPGPDHWSPTAENDKQHSVILFIWHSPLNWKGGRARVRIDLYPRLTQTLKISATSRYFEMTWMIKKHHRQNTQEQKSHHC